MSSIVQLEERLDACLGRPRVAPQALEAVRIAALQWSAAVWAEAQAVAPIALAASDISCGLALARRPVFICGVHRSGTTLVRDLLDGHPALLVLPSEGTYNTSLAHRLRPLCESERLRHLGCEWLRRLANPIHQAPYWLLGRSSPGSSPYVGFARNLAAWWPHVKKGLGAASAWPLAAVALAYASCIGGAMDGNAPTVIRTASRWAEKTPLNERHLGRLHAEFPDSKVIQVVRHPFAVYASHKRMMQSVPGGFANAPQVLRELRRSYRTAAAMTASAGTARALVIRYEDLLERTEATLDALACYLGIERHASMTRPSVAGVPAASNSSFEIDSRPGTLYPREHRMWVDVLTATDRARIVRGLGGLARGLGYRVDRAACERAET